MKKVSDKKLEKVVGGYLFDASGISGSDKDNPWEVLNSKGEVICRCKDRDSAIYNAGLNKESYEEIDWNRVLQLRGQ